MARINSMFNDDVKKKIFKQKIFNYEEAIEAFTKAFIHDKSVNKEFLKLYENGEIPLGFNKVYRAYFYSKGRIISASYNYVKETINEFHEPVTSSYSGYIDDEFEIYDAALFQSNLLFDNKLLYEYENFNDYLSDENFLNSQKRQEQFIKELDYKIVNSLKDKLYKKHSIKEFSTFEKIDMDPISSFKYDDELMFIEPLVDVYFDYGDSKRLKTYHNYISMVTNKMTTYLDMPLDSEFVNFSNKNKPGVFSFVKLDSNELMLYMKEKYTTYLLSRDEFNKYNEMQTIAKAMELLKLNKLEEGLGYIKKAFYLYNSKKVSKAFVTLAKFYLTADNLDFMKASYYLHIIQRIDKDAKYILACLGENGFIKPFNYLTDSINEYMEASRLKSNEAAFRLYYFFKSPRFLNDRLASKYLRLAAKYKNKTATKIYGK